MNLIFLALIVAAAVFGLLCLFVFRNLEYLGIVFLMIAGVSVGMYFSLATQRRGNGLLVVSEYPEGYPRDSRKAEFVHSQNASGYGDSRFYAREEDGVYRLDVFRPDSDIADLSRFSTQLFAEHYVRRLRENEPLSKIDLYQIELCVQSHLAYLASVERKMASAMVCTNHFDLSWSRSLIHKFLSEQSCQPRPASRRLCEADAPQPRQGASFLHLSLGANSCCAMGFLWPSATVKQIDALAALWQEREFAKKVEEYGYFFSLNEPQYLDVLYKEIEKNATHEIRDKAYRRARYDFENAEKSVHVWRELQAELYNGPLVSLSKIHIEAQRALSKAQDVEGYAGLRKLMERWRPIMREVSRNYAYLTADLPVVVMAQRAFVVTDENTHWYGTNREAIKRIAYQYVRATGDGAMLKYTRSHYAADQLLQYHRYVKKVLGKDEYGAFMSSLKMVKENELDHSVEDWFGEANGASRSFSPDFGCAQDEVQ